MGQPLKGDGGIHHRAEELAAQLPPLLVAAERVAATVSQGVHGRRRVGQGETFWQYRRYQPGDPVAQIDWRRSAKSDRVYVRETEWEAAESVWLWRDSSPSMRYASSADTQSKLVRAELLTLALAALLVRGGERVALVGTGQPPASGKAVMARLAAQLEGSREKAANLPAREPLPRHARVVLIGDFLSTPEEVRQAVSAFGGQGLRGHLLQITDIAEETLPFEGRIRFRGTEGEGSHLVGKVQGLRDAYRQSFRDHRESLAAIARSAGWTFAHHVTANPPEQALLALYLALSETGIGRVMEAGSPPI